MLGETGWRLSPAFDVNPNPSGQRLTLGIDGAASELSFDLVRKTAPYYETTDREAAKLIDEARLLLKDWRDRAKRFGLGAADRDILAPAFETSWK